MTLVDKQLEIISFVKKYLKENEKKIITSLSGLCYFRAWSDAPGNAKIKLWINGKFYIFKFIYIIFKNILSIAANSNYLVYNDIIDKEKYDTLVLTWSSKDNFKPDGSFHDKYFDEIDKASFQHHGPLLK